jgi:predicted ATP-dependent endonuclease of OLD family
MLVGANNSGKSTIIDAIRAFYEKDGYKYKKDSDFPLKGAVDQESWIELTFILTESEYISLAEGYQAASKQLKVKKYFQTTTKLGDKKNAGGSILGFKSDGTLSDEPFYGAKNVQSGKFGDLIYIPAVSKVDEHTKLSGPSALRDLISNIMSDVFEDSDAYKDFATNVRTFADKAKSLETTEKRSLVGFESDLNSLLSTWQTKFNLRFSAPSTSEIIKSMLEWDIQDDHHDKSQGVESFGSGFQRHFIYSLVRLGAEYMPRTVQRKAKDFTPALNLVLFEEPEAFLHPPQQYELARNLIKVSESDDWQVIMATHSAHFVSRNANHIADIIRVQRSEGLISAFQIQDDAWKSIIDANQSIRPLLAKYPKICKKMEDDDFKPIMESVKYFLFLNPDRASMFFAHQVLIVEGPSETAFINKLIDDYKLTLPSGIYILDSLGKYNTHRFMNLLSGLGIAHSVLHDDDNSKEEHKELNQLIADSRKKGITVEVKQIAGDLETALGIAKPKSEHRKPQHILYLYTDNKIEPNRLNDFCRLVESCFPGNK